MVHLNLEDDQSMVYLTRDVHGFFRWGAGFFRWGAGFFRWGAGFFRWGAGDAPQVVRWCGGALSCFV